MSPVPINSINNFQVCFLSFVFGYVPVAWEEIFVIITGCRHYYFSINDQVYTSLSRMGTACNIERNILILDCKCSGSQFTGRFVVICIRVCQETSIVAAKIILVTLFARGRLSAESSTFYLPAIVISGLKVIEYFIFSVFTGNLGRKIIHFHVHVDRFPAIIVNNLILQHSICTPFQINTYQILHPSFQIGGNLFIRRILDGIFHYCGWSGRTFGIQWNEWRIEFCRNSDRQFLLLLGIFNKSDRIFTYKGDIIKILFIQFFCYGFITIVYCNFESLVNIAHRLEGLVANLPRTQWSVEV